MRSSETASEFLTWANEHAHRERQRGHRPSEADLISASLNEGITPVWSDLVALGEEQMRSSWSVPRLHVLRFLRSYLAGRQATLLLDPFATSPVLGMALQDVGVADGAVMLCPSPTVADLGRRLATGWSPGLWPVTDVGDPVLAGERMPDVVDLVVAVPPMGLPPASADVSRAGTTLNIRDQGGRTNAAVALSRLSPNGEAILITTPNWWFEKRPKGLRAQLDQLGLAVHAAIDVDRPFTGTGVGAVILAIRQGPCDEVFAAHLSEDADPESLSENLRQRRGAKAPQLGVLAPSDGYSGFAHWQSQSELPTLSRKAGVPFCTIGELLGGEVPAMARDDQRYADVANAIYLPSFPSAYATDDPGSLDSHKGYYQVPLDRDKALAAYAVLALNSPLGRKLRHSYAHGVTVPRISRSMLLDLPVPMPDTTVQVQALESAASIARIRAHLDDLEARVLNTPAAASKVQRELQRLEPADGAEKWLDQLPFPLASVLWRYQADADPRSKLDHALSFFEAAATYFATVLLSGFARTPSLLAEQLRGWGGVDGAGPQMRRSSFGAWTMLGSQIAASTRRVLARDEDSADRQQLTAAFAVSSRSFIDAVASKELWRRLDVAREVRNELAHGGILGRSSLGGYLAQLDSEQTGLRKLLGDPLDEVRLVRPGSATRRQGISEHARAELLQGPNAHFKQTDIRMLPALDNSDELHLLDADADPAPAALPLLPFFRMRAAPQTEELACYFYASVNGDDVEFVSHHFERESRIHDRDQGVLDALALLDAQR